MILLNNASEQSMVVISVDQGCSPRNEVWMAGTELEPKYSSVISFPSFSCFSPYCWRPEITF